MKRISTEAYCASKLFVQFIRYSFQYFGGLLSLIYVCVFFCWKISFRSGKSEIKKQFRERDKLQTNNKKNCFIEIDSTRKQRSTINCGFHTMTIYFTIYTIKQLSQSDLFKLSEWVERDGGDERKRGRLYICLGQCACRNFRHCEWVNRWIVFEIRIHTQNIWAKVRMRTKKNGTNRHYLNYAVLCSVWTHSIFLVMPFSLWVRSLIAIFDDVALQNETRKWKWCATIRVNTMARSVLSLSSLLTQFLFRVRGMLWAPCVDVYVFSVFVCMCNSSVVVAGRFVCVYVFVCITI